MKHKDIDFPNTHPAYILATWFWIGKIKYAPGTWGTLAALPLWLPLVLFAPLWLYLIIFAALYIAGTAAINHIQTQTKTHDASSIVIDEVLGLGLVFLIFYLIPPMLLFIALATALFRLFDILKPYPCNRIDKTLKNAHGVILDDLIAGCYTTVNLILLLLILQNTYLHGMNF